MNQQVTEFLTADDVTYTVAATWESYLSQSVIATSPMAPDTGPTLVSEVRIEGEWNGTIRVEMPVPLAELVTSAMLGAEPTSYDDTQSSVDIKDAVGELVNIVAGGIKSLAPQPSALTLPTVKHHHEPSMTQADLTVHYQTSSHTFLVGISHDR